MNRWNREASCIDNISKTIHYVFHCVINKRNVKKLNTVKLFNIIITSIYSHWWYFWNIAVSFLVNFLKVVLLLLLLLLRMALQKCCSFTICYNIHFSTCQSHVITIVNKHHQSNTSYYQIDSSCNQTTIAINYKLNA